MSEDTLYDKKKDETVDDEDATVCDQNEKVNEETTTEERVASENEQNASADKKRARAKTAGIAGAAAVAGVAAGLFTPIQVFPDNPDDPVDPENTDNHENPVVEQHLEGHDMPIATSVNDDMSFNEAFAAARTEVGSGGIFTWHGHTYGTYYGSEWNSMTPEEQNQYWADVHHTTNTINENYQPEPEPEPTPEPEPEPTPEVRTEFSEDDYIDTLDLDGDGQADIAIVDANGNAMPDMLVDMDSNGQMDTLVVDPVIDDEGNLTDASDIISLEHGDEPVPVEPDPLTITSDEVVMILDTNDDDMPDLVVADLNGNDQPDLILDTDTDGKFDVVVMDSQMDDEGNVIIDESSVMEINGLDVVETPIDPSLGETEGIIACNDFDTTADLSFDPNIMDNDMGMGDL